MRFTVALFLSTIFFVLGLLTLPHYGINWDTINHLPRGQAYLHYFLTGRKDYNDLQPRVLYWQDPDSLSIKTNLPKGEVPSRSFYQNDATIFTWFMPYDGDGHPPLSDILSSLSNRILFGKLGLINDIDSYRVYGIFLAAVLVGLIFWWVSTLYGKFAGFIASLSLGLYPLFWSESHFNTEKDIPETAFWSFTIFAVWKAVETKSWRWILLAGVFFGLALGTKFNILFSAIVILPWLVIVLTKPFLREKVKMGVLIKQNCKIIVAALTAPLLGLLIFLGSWPYLWQDFIAGLGRVVKFYKGIGLTSSIDPRFVGPLHINTYSLVWVAYTTPLVILVLSLLGIPKAFLKIKEEENKSSLLFLLWLVIPITRVVWPGTTIYGGVRQIMEYIPAMSVLAGLGGLAVKDWLLKILPRTEIIRQGVGVLIILAFVPITIRLIQIHPNENVYFNSLVRGLAGAREQNLPSWGNNFGAAYRQGISWINKNAEPNADLVFAYELMPNVPTIWVRPDITFHNSRRSGFLRRGEYAITLSYEGSGGRSYYDSYLEQFLEPVYQVKVDGVPILKVWKNDLAHTRVPYIRQERIEGIGWRNHESSMEVDLKRLVSLSHLIYTFDKNNCQPLKSAIVSISRDGLNWNRLKESLPSGQISILGEQPSDGSLTYPFLGEEARYIRFEVLPVEACLNKTLDIQVFNLPNLKKG